MTRQEADTLAAAMRSEGWTEVRVEPSLEDGYTVAYRRRPDESFRRARQLSPAIRARLLLETEGPNQAQEPKTNS